MNLKLSCLHELVTASRWIRSKICSQFSPTESKRVMVWSWGDRPSDGWRDFLAPKRPSVSWQAAADVCVGNCTDSSRTVLYSKWMFCLRSFLAYTSDGNLSDESFEEPVTHLDLTVDAQVGAWKHGFSFSVLSIQFLYVSVKVFPSVLRIEFLQFPRRLQQSHTCMTEPQQASIIEHGPIPFIVANFSQQVFGALGATPLGSMGALSKSNQMPCNQSLGTAPPAAGVCWRRPNNRRRTPGIATHYFERLCCRVPGIRFHFRKDIQRMDVHSGCGILLPHQQRGLLYLFCCLVFCCRICLALEQWDEKV